MENFLSKNNFTVAIIFEDIGVWKNKENLFHLIFLIDKYILSPKKTVNETFSKYR